MEKIKNTLGWIGTALFAILLFTGGNSAIFWLLSILNIIPIKKLQAFKREKMRIGTFLSIIIGIGLFAAGGIMMPEPEKEDTVTLVIENTETTTSEIATSTTPEKNTATEDGEPKPSGNMTVRFIDVGQADAALVECEGHYMLIDGGNVEDSSTIYSILSSSGIDKLDMIVGTHAHEDHIGGLAGALNYATANLILCPVTDYDSKAFADFKKYAEMQGSCITIPNKKDTYNLGSAEILVLSVNCENDENNSSIVLKVNYGETSFIFTGDADRETEQAIINSGVDLSADVLKVGHHGSDTSTSYVWINEIMPEYAVISVGKDNSYGHPTDEVLSRLRDAEIKTYRTDLNGDIIAVSDGKTVTFTTDKYATDEDIFKAGVFEDTKEPQTSDEDASGTYSADYVVNTNTGKFHVPSCSSVSDIKDSNRWDYCGTKDELTNMGYEACKRCKP